MTDIIYSDKYRTLEASPYISGTGLSVRLRVTRDDSIDTIYLTSEAANLLADYIKTHLKPI